MREAYLRELLIPAPDAVQLLPDVEYATVGILSYGRGLFERKVKRGREISYSTYYRLREGQFVYSRLFAWEGALAIVPARFDGYFVSQEFPVFDLNPTALSPGYLSLLCQRPSLWTQLADAVTGMGGRRKRVHPAALLSACVPLPDLDEQRRIVDMIASIDAATDRTKAVDVAGARAYRVAANELLTGSGFPLSLLGAAVEVTMGRQRSPTHASGKYMTPYLRAANVKDGRLWLDDVLTMNFDPREQATFGLRPGDVLVTEGCGSIGQLGASGPWNENQRGVVCFQNTLLRLRARPGYSIAGYVHHLARWAHHEGRWASIASGTNIFHIGSRRAENMPVPVPSLTDQKRISDVLDGLDALARAADQNVISLRELRTAVLESLVSGSTEIPASYDRLLDDAA